MPVGPSRDDVRNQVEKICNHPRFARAKQIRRFLSYVVERRLEEDVDAIQEYAIGLEVLGRDASFDPRVDPIVRVQGGRLRARLREYYEGDGADDPILIELPERGYVPQLSVRPTGSSWPRRRTQNRKRRIARWASSMLVGVVAISSGATAIWLAYQPVAVVTISTRPLTSDEGGQYHPSLSPGGDFVAYVRDSGESGDDIYIRAIDGNERRRFTSTPVSEFEPRWSPTGDWIAFLRQTEASGELDLMIGSPTLGEPKPVLRFPAGDCGSYYDVTRLSWLPDGGSIVVAYPTEPAAPCALHRVSRDGLRSERLTSPPPGINGDSRPAVAPNGDMVAFVRTESVGQGRLYIGPIDGEDSVESGIRLLAGDTSWNTRPIWSPSGGSLLLSSGSQELPMGMAIWQVAIRDGERRIASGFPLEEALDLTVSRDGRRIVYRRSEVQPSIFSVRLADPPPREIRRIDEVSSTRGDGHPLFSPDGSAVSFVSSRSGPVGIWVKQQGSPPEPLYVREGVYAGAHSWSPDGRYIAAGANPHGNWDVFLIDVATREVRDFIVHPADDGSLMWAPNSRWLYFASDRSGRFELWRMSQDQTVTEQVTRTGFYSGQLTPDGKLMFFLKTAPQPMNALWVRNMETGDERVAVERIWDRSFLVTGRHVYFVSRAVDGSTYAIQRLATNQRQPPETVVELGESWLPEIGLVLTPNGKELWFAASDRPKSDLVLVENYFEVAGRASR